MNGQKRSNTKKKNQNFTDRIKIITFGSYGLTDKVLASMTETTADRFKGSFTPSVSTMM
jgi:hypothetical protein